MDERSKEKHLKTYKICNKLYLEVFKVFGSGAYGGDIHAEYVTDSIHFRMFIGTEDTANEILFTSCKNDSLIIKKSTINREKKSQQLNFLKTYSIKGLIQDGKFE